MRQWNPQPGTGGVVAITRHNIHAQLSETSLADRRFAAWLRNHDWPQVSDNGKVFGK